MTQDFHERWLRWCKQVESEVGFSIDGKQDLDDAFFHFTAGDSSHFYAQYLQYNRADKPERVAR